MKLTNPFDALKNETSDIEITFNFIINYQNKQNKIIWKKNIKIIKLILITKFAEYIN